ncbi:hypothetical protein LTR70_005630 [Exophiala xenobiotica]|uniref:Geranylgeranyl pyrophosphate synthetase n=1 Tax=Lithohypha guttulata TaxID=1690604 RepID=A0ABR0JZJ1_9EURO|nr:hypothetical protein LTR24_008833 [Lithohypha guttulata]KAK5317950.1 hypothetical protein LTR70_005630 [Exophiala xenobiotica]
MTFSRSSFGRGQRAGHRGAPGGHDFRRTPAASLPKPEHSQRQIESIAAAPALTEDFDDKIRIENVEYVTSFNWKETRDPTIIVPGKPPRWQPPSSAQSLHEDGGIYYRDPNSARFPSYPTEPAIRAIRERIPDFDLSEIDVFGCGNTVGSLLSFARDEERTFRFGVESIGSSLFLVRKTNTPRETIEDVRGYGHTFPEAYTTWARDVRGSASHQRVIKYDFAGLKCFIRSESDGYLPDLVDHNKSTSEQKHEDGDDPLSDTNRLMALALGLQVPSTAIDLTVQHAGEPTPQQALFDLKTRALKTKRAGDISVDDFLHRMWVNQTPNFILAFHTYGKFENNNIHIVDVRNKVNEWEAQNATMLSKLGGLLHKLINVATQNGESRFEVRRVGKGPLQLWSEVPQWSALSPGLKALWGVKDRHETRALQAEQNKLVHEDDEDADYLKF